MEDSCLGVCLENFFHSVEEFRGGVSTAVQNACGRNTFDVWSTLNLSFFREILFQKHAAVCWCLLHGSKPKNGFLGYRLFFNNNNQATLQGSGFLKAFERGCSVVGYQKHMGPQLTRLLNQQDSIGCLIIDEVHERDAGTWEDEKMTMRLAALSAKTQEYACYVYYWLTPVAVVFEVDDTRK